MEFSQKVGMMLYTALKLKIPEILPSNIDDLALRTNTKKEKLERLLLALESLKVFRFNSETKEWENSETELNTYHWLWRFNAFHRLSATSTLDSLFTNKTCIEMYYQQPYFEVLKQNPSFLQEFQDDMNNRTVKYLPEIVDSLDLGNVKSILDVGGGKGYFMAYLLKKYPFLKVGVFERPEIVPMVNQVALENNCEIQAIEGDFFQRVEKGFECLFMKIILHDWSDEDCIRILKNCRSALEIGDLLYVFEIIIDRNSQQYQFQRYSDTVMLCFVGGYERTLEQFSCLFTAAGFEIEDIQTCSVLSIIKTKAV